VRQGEGDTRQPAAHGVALDALAQVRQRADPRDVEEGYGVEGEETEVTELPGGSEVARDGAEGFVVECLVCQFQIKWS